MAAGDSAAAANNKPLGQLLPTPADAIRRYRQGTEIICYSGDVALLQQAARLGLGLDPSETVIGKGVAQRFQRGGRAV